MGSRAKEFKRGLNGLQQAFKWLQCSFEASEAIISYNGLKIEEKINFMNKK